MILKQVLDMQALAFNGELENAMIISIFYKSMNNAIVMCGHLRKIQVSPIDCYWVLSRKKVQAKNSCIS